MPELQIPNGKRASVMLALALASIALAACGGSSSTTPTTTTAPAGAASGGATTGAAGSTGATGTGGTSTRSARAPKSVTGRAGGLLARASGLRYCLQKHGIILPGPKEANGRPSAAGKLPPGVTRTQLAAASRACGGFRRLGVGGALRSPQARQALSKFATCMRENGARLPQANTSGSGPTFRGANTTSPTFRRALAKCRGELSSVLPSRGRFGASGASGASGG